MGICPKCGVDMDVWGKGHICRPKSSVDIAAVATDQALPTRPRAEKVQEEPEGETKPCPTCGGTGRVQDRKTYMREYMRKRRKQGNGPES